jgi:hypothetical protein
MSPGKETPLLLNKHFSSRQILRQLQLQSPALKEYRSKMKVREKVDPHFSRYVNELGTMIPKLDEFMTRCSDIIAEAEAGHGDAEQLLSNIGALHTSAEHHLGGAKQARARYATLWQN